MDHTTTQKRRRQRDVGVRRHRQRLMAPRDVERSHEVMHVSQVALRFLKPGTVALAAVPFAERDGHKIRPVVVLRVERDTVIVLSCSTSRSRHGHPAHWREICDLEAAGLSRATGVRRRDVRLDRAAVVAVRGMLSDVDRAAVLAMSFGPVAA